MILRLDESRRIFISEQQVRNLLAPTVPALHPLFRVKVAIDVDELVIYAQQFQKRARSNRVLHHVVP